MYLWCTRRSQRCVSDISSDVRHLVILRLTAVSSFRTKSTNFFKKYCGATCCRVLTKGKEKNSPERKAQCTDFVAATVKKTAEIILRELAADEAGKIKIFFQKTRRKFFNLPPRFISLFFCLYVLCIFCTFFRLYQIIF